MARFLRSYGVYYLRKPILDATPAAPPVETTIHSRCVAVPTARRNQLRQPGNIHSRPVFVRTTEGASAGVYEQRYNWIGPRPPLVVLLAPTQQQQTIRTRLVAVRTRVEQARHFAVQGWTGAVIEGVCFDPDDFPVLDFFDRANGSLGANWTSPFDPNDTSPLSVVSNRVTCTGSAGTYGGAYWTPGVAGADVGVFMREVTVGDLYLYARCVNPNTASFSGYAIGFFANGVQIIRVDNTTYSSLNTVLLTINAGDRVGLTVKGNRITAYVNGVAVGSARDSTYSSAGLIGMDMNTVQVADNFQAGPLPTTQVVYGAFNRNMGLRAPMVICPAEFEDRIRPASVAVQAAQRRRYTTDLRPPAVVTQAEVFIAYALRSLLVRTRPRHTVWTLRPPIALQVFSGPRSTLTKTRPRPTTDRLRGPTVVRVPSVDQEQQMIRPWLVRGRPGKTIWRLEPPTVIRVPAVEQEQQTIRTALVQTRPRPTEKTLRPPTVIRIPSVEQKQQTIRSWLVQARPRPTTATLEPPAVVVVNPPVDVTFQVALVRIRPRPTTTLLQPPVFYKATSTIRSELVRTRPRRTRWTLEPPTVLRVFATGNRAVVQTRPRPTTTVLRPPAVVRVPAVEQQQRTLRVELTRTRPRPTTTDRRPPAVERFAPQVTQIRSALVRTRPRPTIRTLRPPTVLRVFAYGRVVLTQIRPRHTIARLFPPAVVEPFREPVSTFIRKWLTRIRPPHTQAKLEPPKGSPIVPGKACLVDVAAFAGCLTDLAATNGCLTDKAATTGCLGDVAGTAGCLDNQSAATATLRNDP